MLVNNLLPQTLAILSIVLFGAIVFMAVVGEPSRYYRLERVLYCYPLGLTVLMMLLFILSLAGISMQVAVKVLPVVAVLAAVVVVGVVKIDVRQFWLAPASFDGPRVRLSEVDWFLLVVIVACLGARLVASLLAPLNDWDGIIMWALKAKALYFHTAWTTDYFQRTNYAQTNQAYPLLVPLLYAWVCAWIGRWDDLGMMIVNPVNLIVFAGLLYFTIRKFTARTVALTVTAIMVSLPTIQWYAECGQADLPLILISGAGLFCLFDWMQHRRWDSIVLAGLLMSGTLFTKQEGKIQLLAELVASGCFIAFTLPPSQRSNAIRQLAAFLAVAILWLLPWLFFQRTIKDFGYYWSALSLSAVRWALFPALIQIIVLDALHWHNQFKIAKWHILWPIVALGLIVSKSVWRHPWIWLLIVFLIHFLVICVVFLGSPVSLTLDTLEIGFERYLMCMLVPLWLVLAKCIDEGWQSWKAAQDKSECHSDSPPIGIIN